MKFQARRSTTLLKRESNTVIFLWNLRNFEEHLFWRTSANDCFCFVSWEKQLLLKENFGKVNPIWPGGTNHPPWYKKCHNVWKANGIDFKFYDFFQNWVGPRYMTKKFFLFRILPCQYFSRAHLFLTEKIALPCSCTWRCFHILTLANFH